MRGGINNLRSALWAFYPDIEEQDLWFCSPHPLLNGDAPMDRIANNDYEAVWALIDQLETGAVV